MSKTQLTYTDYNIFLIKMLIWLGFAGLGFLMSLLGIFYPSIAWGGFFIAGFILIWFMLDKNIFPCISREFWILGLSAILIALVLSFFSTPTVFSGRDQGSISQAAIRLSQNHKLEFSTAASNAFFEIRGPGRALNFPGFHYTENGSLITQFPIVYISWLSMFFSVFGVYGFIIANGILFAIFIVTFYMLLRLFVSKRFGIIGLSFALSSFGIFWFTKFTLSENMALPLVWFAVISLVLFWREQKNINFISLLASLMLLCFARIEGFALLAAMMVIVFFHQDMRRFVLEKKCFRLYLPAFIMTGLVILDAWVDFPFYKEISKALFPTITLPKAQLLGTMSSIVMPSWYFFRIYALYGMIGYFFVSVFGLIWAFKKGFTEKIAPFLLVAPTLVYFYDSHITSDSPWLLRRLMFSLLPVAIFYCTLLLSKIRFRFRNHIATIPSIIAITVILLGMNIIPFLTYATYSENKDLLRQLEKMSKIFEPDSLVLIDQQTTGDGWNMIDEPLSSLYGVDSAYFFNTQDLSKLDLRPFKKVYLVTPETNAQFYLNSTIGNRLSFQTNYELNINKLEGSNDNPFRKASLPAKIHTISKIKIFQITK